MSKIAKVVTAGLAAGVARAVRLPSNDAPRVQADHIADQVLEQPEVKDLIAIVENATNAEPWYQSKVTLFAIGGVLTTLYTAGLDFTDGSPPTPEAFSGYVAALGTQLGVIYSRWVPSKPLGR
jgi:hypothetical protein